ncbi:hypothetical protein GA0115239_11701, partial [Streptomyces sp. BpilaLS-43]|uniref:transcriptional regulator n=1 Tax=Streptomyces sp. BpilaLS-43 TaxID=1839778 RepID=UPI00081AFEF2
GAAPEPVDAPEPAPRSDTGPEPETEPGPESVAEDVTAAVPTGATAVPAPRPKRFGRSRVLLAAAAVVALTVPGALAVHSLTEGDPADEVRPGTAAESAVVTPDTSDRPGAGASPSPSRTSASPSASATGGATGAASASPSSSAAKGEERKNGGVPVRASITSYNWEEPCGQYYLLDEEPDHVPPPPSPQGTRAWARALDGVDGEAMRLQLTLQGDSDEAVVLNALHVRVLGRKPALAWSAYSMGDGCGSGIVPQSFDIDLDDNLPRTKPVAGQDGDTVVPAKDFPYRVSSSDVQVFHLDAHVAGHDVTWYLELEWTSGGRSGTLRIDDGGKPFRTSGIAGRPEYRYRYDTAQWVAPDL